MEKQTSQRIIEYLAEHPNATVRQISRALRLTPADIRYHLAKLIEQDRIIVGEVIISGERGRPARTYSLSRHFYSSNIISLTQSALTILLRKNSADKNFLLQSLADQMLPLNKRPTAKSLTQKIIQIIGLLNQYGYYARWEARSKGPCIIFQNCPYRSLLAQFPELCEIDRLIIKNHLSTEITLNQHIHPHEPEPESCQFFVQQI